MGTFLRLFADELASALEAQRKGNHATTAKHADRAKMWSELHDTATTQRRSGQGGRHRA